MEGGREQEEGWGSVKSERAGDKGKAPGTSTPLTVSPSSSRLYIQYRAPRRPRHRTAIIIGPLSVPTLASTTPNGSLKGKMKKKSVNAKRAAIGRSDQSLAHTDVSRGVACATRALPEVARRTM